jgi:hypothetical protein
MFSLLRNRFGIPGLVAVIALVLAMVGGAFAANKYVITSTKQIKPSVLKALKGKNGGAGPAGTNGTNGTNGAKGDQGVQGVPGTPGTNGNTVRNGTGAPAAGLGNNGDFYIDTASSMIYGPKTAGAWGSGTSLKGQTGFTEVLPPNKTETGAWSTMIGAEGYGIADIAFPIPLANEIAATNVHVIVPGGTGVNGQCTGGTAANPKADPGHLCIYVTIAEGTINPITESKSIKAGSSSENGAGVSGVILKTASSFNGAVGWGTWAVTAP